MLPIYDQVRIFLSNDIVENLKFWRNINHSRLKFLLHTFSDTFIRSTKFQNFLSCWWSVFCFLYIIDSHHILSIYKRSVHSFPGHTLKYHEHSSRLSTSLRVPTHPQGCVGPFRLVLLYFHLWNNNRRMKCSTFHTPQAAEEIWCIFLNIN